MIARVITQINRRTGEKHVCLVDNSEIPLKDMLVTSPGWENSQVIVGRVLILSMDESSEHLEALINAELHSARIEQSVKTQGR